MKKITRKVLSLALAILMSASTFITVPVTVSAENTGRDTAVTWAKSQINKGLDYDGAYGNQCVDLIFYYYQYLGVAQPEGYKNAVDYQYNALPIGWKRIPVTNGFVPQPGDVAVWKANYSWNNGNNWTTENGHVGIVISGNSSTFTTVDQKPSGSAKCEQSTYPIDTLHSVIRPDYSKIGESIVVSYYEDPNNYSVGENNAVLASYVKLSTSTTGITKTGIYLYDSNETLISSYFDPSSEIAKIPEDNEFTMNYNVNNRLGATLTPGTTYKYKFIVTLNGTTYYSPMAEFTTSGVNPEDTPSEVTVSFATDSDRYSVGETNAVLASIVTLSCSTSKITKTGIYLYDANEILISSYFDSSSDIAQIPEGTWFNMYYDVNLRLGATLTPGTTYKYKFMVEIDGNTYYSPVAEFTTSGVNPGDGMGQGPTDDGDCGDNLTWEFYSSTGELRTYGNGNMYDFTMSDIPWASYLEEIKIVTINPGATSIGDYAFYNCSNLTSVTMPDSVTNIGDNAFNLCTKLSNVTMSNGITEIGSYAFYCCNSLSSIAIPDGVKSIGDNAYSYCGLTSVVVPDSVETIGKGAFVSNNNLTSIEVDENNINYCDINGVLFSKDKKEIIQYPTGASSTYVIPSGVTKVGFRAFDSCEKLTSITIPNTVTIIGIHAFFNCKNLENLTIPNSVTKIESYAFSFCTSIDTLTIPESVTTIESFAFANCSDLSSITFKSKNVTIGIFIVDSCSNLKTICCYKDSTADEYFTSSSLTKIYLDEPTINPNALTFTVGSSKAIIGKTISVDIVISNNPGIAGFSFKVGYDSSVMTLIGYECPGWEANSSSFDEDPTKNPVGFSWSRTKDYTANTSILTLTFEIKESAPEGEHSITLTSDDVVSNQAGEDIEYNLVGGKITVIDCTPGDSNGDGVVNSKDAVLLAQLLANWDVEIDLDAADCNGDGAVNSKDAVLLAQYLANWDVTLG